MERIILHCDLNNFFASVECLYHPEYREVPMAVCGNRKERHGIILAKNELAKKYNVKTAETVWQAQQKCPGLLLVPPHMEEYVRFSHMAREIYARYTDQIEPFGIDECWLDVTGSRLLFGSGVEIANALREDMKRELGLTISVGVSFNKIFAKLGSDMKKPDAVTLLSQNTYRERVWPLPAEYLFGVGPSTARSLRRYGICTIGDIAKSDAVFLRRILGKCGDGLYRSANGQEGLTVARQDAKQEVKSIGHSTTCPADLLTEEEVWPVLYRLAEGVGEDLRKKGFLAGSVQITVKDNTLHVEESQGVLPYPTRCPKELADMGLRLFRQSYRWKRPVRLLGIRALRLFEEAEGIQYNLLADQKKIQQEEHLEEQIFRLRQRFGEQAVSRAVLLSAGNGAPVRPR